MACIGAVFTLCRMLSGSLWPAMAAHAAFNLTILAAAIHQFAG
jgi:membrane protease YdiL (CAAX protease family)